MDIFQEEALSELARNGGFQFTDKWFPYTSGHIGPYYVQSMDICKTGKGYQIAIHSIMTIVEQIIGNSDESIDIISGGESRDWPFAFPVAEKLGLAPLMIYKDGKMLGPDIKGKRVLHIADLNNEGSSPRDKWIPAIRNAGGIITDIVFLVDRLEDGEQVMYDLDLHSHAVIPLNQDSWTFLRKDGIINKKELSSLVDYWKDRTTWEIKQILKYPEVLLNLLQKDKAKGLKVFETFYPLTGSDLIKALGFGSRQGFYDTYH